VGDPIPARFTRPMRPPLPRAPWRSMSTPPRTTSPPERPTAPPANDGSPKIHNRGSGLSPISREITGRRRWDSNPAPSCFAVRGRDGGRSLTCDADSPMLTARARRGPAVTDAVRTQHGPASLDYLLAKPDRAGASPAKTVKAQVEVVVVLSVGVRSGPLATVVNGTLVARTVRMALVQRGAASSASTVG
jgi:hypothetical protein